MPARNRRLTLTDPKKINNYNKFLCTLDQKANASKDPISSSGSHEGNTNTNANDIVRSELDNIINRIQNTFTSNNYNLQGFTGKSTTDDAYIHTPDPNYYSDVLNPQYILLYTPSKPQAITHQTTPIPTIPHSNPADVNPVVEIRETINIDAEINNISDILCLIDKYKIDPAIKYNINMKALHDIKLPLIEMNNMIGMSGIKCNIVDQILYFVQELHKSKRQNGDFMHTVIYGPPGTGKTEVAKIIGKIYSNIGLLTKGTFKKVTRSDLIAGYLGQTAVKTRDVIKEALGGVLFIDEAYALGNPEKKDSFAKECIDTLCEALSDHKDNLMVIIAGYDKELKESFFSANPGLDSRFTWRFKIDDYTSDDLYHIFLKKVADIDWELAADSKITIDWFKKHKDCFTFFGRDIETILAKTKIAHSRRVFCKPETEKKKLVLKDLDAGFEMYMQNEEVKGRKNDREMTNYLHNTLYS
jgi:hypothetical protein